MNEKVQQSSKESIAKQLRLLIQQYIAFGGNLLDLFSYNPEDRESYDGPIRTGES